MMPTKSVVLVLVMLGLPSSLGFPTDGFFNIKDTQFAGGAVGDGVHDDRPAIQAAVNTAANTGGVVYLPPGQFAVSAPVMLSKLNNVILRGAGKHPLSCTTRGSSLLALSNSSSTVVVLDTCTQCGVQHLLLSHAAAVSASNAVLASAEATPVVSDPQCLVFAKTAGGTCSSVGHNSAAVSAVVPTSGYSIEIYGSFDVTLEALWFEHVHGGLLLAEMANTVTLLDSFIYGVLGASGVSACGGDAGKRVDILQITRLTTNQPPGVPGYNGSVVWLDIGAGVNTVRLSAVGLINGGVGVKMSAPQDEPAGLSPGRPLFLFAEDLEIDFPSSHGLWLDVGESALLTNSYIQGSLTGSGIYIGPRWNSEVQITNTRIFGHHLAGVHVAGGRRFLMNNCIVGDNSMIGVNQTSGVVIEANVSNFQMSNNQIGPVFAQQAECNHRYGVDIAPGSSDGYIVMGNDCSGNQMGGVSDGGSAPRQGKQVLGNLGTGR